MEFSISKSFLTIASVCMLGIVLSMGTTPAMAQGVEDLGLFELEGDAWDSSGYGTPPDDWDTLFDGQGHEMYFRMLQDVPSDDPNHQIAEGGDKDIHLIEDWGWVYGGALDKGDITNGYAAAYDDSGQLIVYFGADRFGHDGDTFLGFWFFKDEVYADIDGSFVGSHELGDILVLVNFPQASNKEPEIKILDWFPACDKAVKDPEPGECAADNLRLRAGVSGAGAICWNGTGQGIDAACAITNSEDGINDPTPSPWPYTSKYGDIDQFPYETFFEGGINLTQLIGGDTCFSSFMAETRSSSSFTAQRKDWLLGEFDLCKIEVSKDCDNPRLDPQDDTKILYDISGTVTNSGFATMYNLTYTDYLWDTDLDPDAYVAYPFASFAWAGDPAVLVAGDSIGYSATLSLPLGKNAFDDKIIVTANTEADDSGTFKEASDTADCPSLQVSPELEVTKNCKSFIDVLTDPTVVVAQVYVSGTVKNIGLAVDGPIKNVTVTDDKAGSLTLAQTTLAPGEETTYSGYYYPSTALDNDDVETNDPCLVVFKDTVTAAGQDVFGADVLQQTAEAKCGLCVCDEP